MQPQLAALTEMGPPIGLLILQQATTSSGDTAGLRTVFAMHTYDTPSIRQLRVTL
jgi:hypothetical protein